MSQGCELISAILLFVHFIIYIVVIYSYVLYSSFMNLKWMFYDILDSKHACTCGRFCVNLSSIKQRQEVNASDVF